MISQGTFNNIDFQAFGAVINKGMDAFFNWGKRKDSVNHNYQEEDGEDRDLVDPHVDPREFAVSFTITAAGLADFKTKYWGFRNEVMSAGLNEFYFADHDETYLVYYKEQQNLKKITSRFTSEIVGISFDIIFSETNPQDNVGDYLVDEQDNFIIGI
ncbi:hypothetical protein ACFS5N_16245 [Mucilaginibacter ximonensis]|uniref:Uncharacterized protein n=1 Tax=Mucilaginibacter ximonensis TaxID=538021 RepID=A0ABW5YF99_9SPHI